jgi:AcrR family transcriptional regulator
MSPTREERKEEIARMRKRQIIDAALEVFSSKGFALATTAEIAREADISEGTIYNYFPSKRDLFIEVIRNFIITAPLLELIEQLPERNIESTFNEIMQNRFNLLESEHIKLMPTFMAEIQRDPELRVLWRDEFIQPFFTKMEGIYEKLTASGKVRRMKPEIFVRIIGGMLLGFFILKIMEGEDSPLNRLPRKEAINAMVTMMIRGLLDDNTDKKNKEEGVL